MKYVKLFLLTVVVLCSFSNEKIPKIDLPAHTPKQTAQISKLFRKVRYVPLETTDDCLLSYIHVQKIHKGHTDHQYHDSLEKCPCPGIFHP